MINSSKRIGDYFSLLIQKWFHSACGKLKQLKDEDHNDQVHSFCKWSLRTFFSCSKALHKIGKYREKSISWEHGEKAPALGQQIQLACF